MFRHKTASERSGSRSRGGAGDGERESARTEQAALIHAALEELRETTVREVMTPRVDVVALPIPVSGEDVARTVRETGHSAFPVYNEHLDNLVGVLFVNDLFRAGWTVTGSQEGRSSPTPIDISRRLRQPFLVPESRLVLDVLAEMRRQRRAFAVVVDEHGGVEGVLTVKDLLGALVGALPDEFDPDEEPEVVRVDGKRWLVDGRTSVDDLADLLGIDLPEGEYVTLGGYLFDAFGHIPEEGETHDLDGWQLRVSEMDKRRIAKVVVKRTSADPFGTGGGDPDGRGTDHTAVG